MGFGIGRGLASLMQEGVQEGMREICKFMYHKKSCLGSIPQYEDDRKGHIVYGPSHYERLPWRKTWAASVRCAVGLRYSPYCEVPWAAKRDELGGRCDSRSKDRYNDGVRHRCRTGSFRKECA